MVQIKATEKDDLIPLSGLVVWKTRPHVASEAEFLIQEQLLGINVKRFRGGLVFKAHGPVYHSSLGSRVRKKKREESEASARGRRHDGQARVDSRELSPSSNSAFSFILSNACLPPAALEPFDLRRARPGPGSHRFLPCLAPTTELSNGSNVIPRRALPTLGPQTFFLFAGKLLLLLLLYYSRALEFSDAKVHEP